MIEKAVHRLFLLAAACFLCFFPLFAQPGNFLISGPAQLCPGECGDYFVVSSDPTHVVVVAQWYINGNPPVTTSGPGPFTLCADALSQGFSIAVSINLANGQVYGAESFIEVVAGVNPVIISTSAACPEDLTTDCDRVCANSYATYEATGIPAGTPLTWEVIGAESYTANGNQLTVKWGAPGQGKVTVTTSPDPPFQLFCGIGLVSQPGSTLSATLRGIWYGGTPPYSLTIQNALGAVVYSGVSALNEYIGNTYFPPGLYTFTVEDADGKVATCETTINTANQNCWLSIYPDELISPSGSLDCNGFIHMVASGIEPNVSFLWSTGLTSPTAAELCCGTYTVVATNASTCTTSVTIELPCPTCPGSSSLCVEILEQPQALIGAIPAALNDTIEICQGQTVFFQNQSLYASSYIWDFGDLNISTQFNPSHTYTTPGIFTASLIARNACFCSDTTLVFVKVLATEVPPLSCRGTVCEGETVTYSTAGGCNNYNWNITGGGTILDGGGSGDDFITVQWYAGPQGTVSLDVSGCPGSVCTLPNVLPIPIVSDNAQIQGRSKVCESSTEEYFIPGFAGTEINWTVLGSGTITDGQGTERITVKWTGDANAGNPQLVIVEFENCYLGCGGKDTLEVSILPGFYAGGPIEVCQNDTATYRSRNTITNNLMNSYWQLSNATGALVWTSATAVSTVNIPFNLPPGNYTVRATAASATGFCNSTFDVFVKIVALPPPVTAVDGEAAICPGKPYVYQAQGLPNSQFAWTVTGGTPAAFSGNPASVTWDAMPPYSLAVEQIAPAGLACPSLPFTLQVNPLPDFSISGSGQICREATGTYSVPSFEGIDYQWTVTPADAGTIVSGQGTDSVEVFWHAEGLATLSLAACSLNKNFGVTVLPLPKPIVPDASVCFGETTLLTPTASFTTYVWKNEQGDSVSNLSSPGLGAGFYSLEVEDANGCLGGTTFKVVETPAPVVNISAPIYLGFCPGGPPVTIYATTSGVGYDYTWFQNGLPVGTNSSTYQTNLPDLYKVVVTDPFGCTAESSTLLLSDCEAAGGECAGAVCGYGGGSIPGGPCVPGGTLDFSIFATGDCSTHQYQNTSVNFISGTLLWDFGDPLSGLDNQSSLENPQHTFSKPGFYSILLRGDVPDALDPDSVCPGAFIMQDTIPAIADFQYETACPGVPIAFFDRTEYLDFANITAWSWDFGDPGSGAANASNQQNPVHSYNAEGTYTVKLVVTEASGCQSEISKDILVQALPTVSFVLPAQTCEDQVLPFVANASAEVASLAWSFGDPGSGAANTSAQANPHHRFSLPGNYEVSLMATSVHGCVSSFSDTLTIEPNVLGGVIAYSQPPPICPGDTIVLSSPSGGTAWSWTTGAATDHISVFQTGNYSVTLTDAKGCTFSPPAAPVTVWGEPNAIIKGVEYNEFGQLVTFYENNMARCEGEEVTLVVQGSLNYGYVWSNGLPGDEISFTSDKNNLLPQGVHVFTVTVTDHSTGCTSVEGPFTITVNPRPDVQITSTPSGFLCENNTALLSVTSPQPNVTYNWNTGETGTEIPVVAGGTYFAFAVNQFGCQTRSNEIVVNKAPDINLIPGGCHERCSPDTICLPSIPNIASYQWFFNGNPIPDPEGGLPNPVFDQSGDYHVELTDVFGCTSVSDVLSLTVNPNLGSGDILGLVYFDTNENGIIDAGDTPVGGIDIFLSDGTTKLDTVSSNADGSYTFQNLHPDDYALLLDLASLPQGWTALLDSTFLSLGGCNSLLYFNWLLSFACTTATSTLELQACEGGGATFEGVFIPAGSSQDFTYQISPGCDSVLTVTVLSLPNDADTLELKTCPDTVAVYAGQTLAPGDVQDFIFQNQYGCDSVVTVMVSAYPTAITFVDAVLCEGEFFEYNGVQIPAGSTQIFTEVNADGCLDSVFVSVIGLPTSNSSLHLVSCGGVPVTYAGQTLMPGDVQDFIFKNKVGCDSVVTVTVTGVPLDTTEIELKVCEGQAIEFGGLQLAAGDEQYFTFPDQMGCDSVVAVSVAAYPAATYDLVASVICWNKNDGGIAVQNPGGAALPYLFSLDSTNWQPDLLFDSLPPGRYTVFLQDGNNCIYKRETEIAAIPPISLTAEDQTLVCGDSLLLAPVAVSSLPLTWEWPDGSSLPQFWVKTSGIYSLKVKNDCETVEKQIRVDMEPFDFEKLIYMPNSFSPNGDGINDCYRGYLSPRVEVPYFILKIFDRWGELVFETSDPEGCWDGIFKGDPMKPAVFAWYIEMDVLDCSGQVRRLFKKGGLHLMK